MTTTDFAPADIEPAEEIDRLRAQVKRLQRFAFRDLLAATPEELSNAVDSLTRHDRSLLRHHLIAPADSPADRSVAQAPVSDESRQIAWRIKAGTIERSAVAQ